MTRDVFGGNIIPTPLSNQSGLLPRARRHVSGPSLQQIQRGGLQPTHRQHHEGQYCSVEILSLEDLGLSFGVKWNEGLRLVNCPGK